MKVGSVGRGRFSPSRLLRLVPGQTVRGRVIARLGEGQFRVGISGRHFDASSDLPLEPGQRLTARVEVDDTKVFLRIFEDEGRERRGQRRKEGMAEIRRILKGLGLQTSPMDVVEFNERLDRYRSYGSIRDAEPSDAWVLAILWTRGIRGGADAFALLSFYLRHASLNASNELHPAKPAEFLSLMDGDGSGNQEVEKAKPPGQNFGSNLIFDRFSTERNREAVALLNRNAAQTGYFWRLWSINQMDCAQIIGRENATLGRWTDNPASPKFLVEAGCAQGRVKARLHRLICGESAETDSGNRLINLWEEALPHFNFELEETEVSAVQDSETLRFLFWRTWDSGSVRDLVV